MFKTELQSNSNLTVNNQHFGCLLIYFLRETSSPITLVLQKVACVGKLFLRKRQSSFKRGKCRNAPQRMFMINAISWYLQLSHYFKPISFSHYNYIRLSLFKVKKTVRGNSLLSFLNKYEIKYVWTHHIHDRENICRDVMIITLVITNQLTINNNQSFDGFSRRSFSLGNNKALTITSRFAWRQWATVPLFSLKLNGFEFDFTVR